MRCPQLESQFIHYHLWAVVKCHVIHHHLLNPFMYDFMCFFSTSPGIYIYIYIYMNTYTHCLTRCVGFVSMWWGFGRTGRRWSLCSTLNATMGPMRPGVWEKIMLSSIPSMKPLLMKTLLVKSSQLLFQTSCRFVGCVVQRRVMMVILPTAIPTSLLMRGGGQLWVVVFHGQCRLATRTSNALISIWSCLISFTLGIWEWRAIFWEARWSWFCNSAISLQGRRWKLDCWKRPIHWKCLPNNMVTHYAAKSSPRASCAGRLGNTHHWVFQDTMPMWLLYGWRMCCLDITRNTRRYLPCCGWATEPYLWCTVKRVGFWVSKRRTLWKSLALRFWKFTCPWLWLPCSSTSCCGRYVRRSTYYVMCSGRFALATLLGTAHG